MSTKLWFLATALLVLAQLAGCFDSTTPPGTPDPDLDRASVPDSVPHDFLVTTDPAVLEPGSSAAVTVRWSDANLNMSSVGMTMEGARIIGRWSIGRDEETGQYTCLQVMATPAEFLSNKLFILVGDPDGDVTHIHEVAIAGGFVPPENRAPYGVLVHTYPSRITPGQTVAIDLQGYDDENNMVAGMSVAYEGGEAVALVAGSERFSFSADAHVFKYHQEFTAPAEMGDYALTLSVADDAGELYSYESTLVVEGPNNAPYFTEIWLEDRVLAGNADSLPFRVAAMDDDGDRLLLMTTSIYGSTEYDLLGTASGDSTVWSGRFIPSFMPEGQLVFRVSDGNVEVPGDTLRILVDHSGMPVLDRYFITLDGDGPYEVPTADNVYLGAAPGASIVCELEARDPQGGALTYAWSMFVDNVQATSGTGARYEGALPDFPCQVSINCSVRDGDGNRTGLLPTIIAVH